MIRQRLLMMSSNNESNLITKIFATRRLMGSKSIKKFKPRRMLKRGSECQRLICTTKIMSLLKQSQKRRNNSTKNAN